MIELSDRIIDLIEQARTHIAKAANGTMVSVYFSIGRLIVENVQGGEKRARYGDSLLQQILKDLNQRYGKGFSVQNLERMRNFYSIYSKSSKELRNSDLFEKSSNVLRISSANNEINDNNPS